MPVENQRMLSTVVYLHFFYLFCICLLVSADIKGVTSLYSLKSRFCVSRNCKVEWAIIRGGRRCLSFYVAEWQERDPAVLCLLSECYLPNVAQLAITLEKKASEIQADNSSGGARVCMSQVWTVTKTLDTRSLCKFFKFRVPDVTSAFFRTDFTALCCFASISEIFHF